MSGVSQDIPQDRRRLSKSYPEYKDSGVEGLGEIPAHWPASVFKRLARLAYGDSLPEEKRESGEVLVYGSNGSVGTHAFANTLAPVLILGRKGSYGKVNYSKVPVYAIDTTYFIDPRTSKVNMRWLYYACQLLGLDAYSEDSAVPGLSREYVYGRVIPDPPVDEQLAIASFLDRETARIDSLVAKKERLIELLQEKRTALITQAVTKGLDPNAPMKHSGVEWIGDIPENWSVVRVKQLFAERDQRSLFGDEELLTVSHITGVTRRSEKDVTMFEPESYEGYKLCCSGDLVINTMWAWMGAIGVAKEEGMVSPSYNVYAPRDGSLDGRYIDYLVRIPSHVTDVTRLSKGIWRSRLRLYPDAFFEILWPVPPTVTQQEIVDFLDHETTEAYSLENKIRHAISLLREYRTALISAAVTGKIDVRGSLHEGDALHDSAIMD